MYYGTGDHERGGEEPDRYCAVQDIITLIAKQLSDVYTL